MENDKSNEVYQILVINISYGKEFTTKIKNRPNMVSLDLPDGILKYHSQISKFYDSVEQYAYNTVTKKFGAEVEHCQVWLPLD